MARVTVDEILETPFCSRSYLEQLNIVRGEKPRPALKDLTSKHSDKKCSYSYIRRFSLSQYENTEWLTGCDVRVKLFCWPCLLFSREDTVWNKHGYSDLNHLTEALGKHERSRAHVKAFMAFKLFGKRRMDTLVETDKNAEINKHNAEVKKNRELLKRFIDVVCHLAKQELPFRGHDESRTSANRGNYIELLNLVRTYDSLLDSHLNSSTVFQGISPTLQIGIIQAISIVVMDNIKKEISSAPFTAIIINETSDVMSESQLSTVLRYVHEGEVHERFVGFSDMSADWTADGLFWHVKSVVEEFQIKDKLVGQTYDGASVVSRDLDELQRKVLDESPNAIFTHCYAHVLNVVLQQDLSSIRECRIFFQTLSGLADFFSKSSKRLDALQEFVERRLLSVAPTRWNFTSRLYNTIQKFRPQLIDFFQYIIDNSENWDSDTTVKAQGFFSFLQNFQTVFLLEVFSKLFGYTAVLHNVLQSNVYDVPCCCKKVDKVLKQLLHDKEHDFESLWGTALSSISSCDEPRQIRHRFMNEQDEKDTYLTLYQSIVESLCTQIKNRYSSLSKLQFFQLLWHEKYDYYNKQFPTDLLVQLRDFYGSLFDCTRLRNELVVLYAREEFSGKSVHELVAFMVENGLTSGFKEVFKLGNLILTIPINTASAERSLSALKRINTCYRGAQAQERLSGLSLLYIEKPLLMEIKQSASFYDEVIDKFTSQKRRIELTYK